MELTKLEIAIVLGAFVQGLGEEALNNGNDSLKELEKELDKIVSNSTINQMKEAGESVIGKLIHKLLEDEEQ
ncbi:hypothetical protein MNO09_10890 [Bacillus sp. N5-665]|uniref:hypothetical protein n=1 Tax=Bacillus sp. N5-665 TaxID=2925318 RepID=UPI001F534F2A|nr:hypothetical protein [Bacillus sp. N5-665]UNK35299.1 hypothetical protein MNO09_10890 [Bacillus sp. N5-665]HDR4460015.1 hypothetical protein [Bacillus cereus]